MGRTSDSTRRMVKKYEMKKEAIIYRFFLIVSLCTQQLLIGRFEKHFVALF